MTVNLVIFPPKNGVLGWVEACRKLKRLGRGGPGITPSMVPGAPALGLELGREQPP